MNRKSFIWLLAILITIHSKAQIYSVGQGSGFAYQCYLQADNPFLNIYATGGGSGFHSDCILLSPLTVLATLSPSIEARCHGQHVTLYWSAAPNSNGYFTIERSLDGIQYQSLTTIPLSDMGNASAFYQYTDQNRPAGKLYYRVVHSNMAGQTNISRVVAVECSREASIVHIYPNPTSGIIHISGMGVLTGYTLRNHLGQELLVSRKNFQDAVLDLSSLKPGMYYLEVDTDRGRTFHKIIRTGH